MVLCTGKTNAPEEGIGTSDPEVAIAESPTSTDPETTTQESTETESPTTKEELSPTIMTEVTAILTETIETCEMIILLGIEAIAIPQEVEETAAIQGETTDRTSIIVTCPEVEAATSEKVDLPEIWMTAPETNPETDTMRITTTGDLMKEEGKWLT